jgi:cytochrome b561
MKAYLFLSAVWIALPILVAQNLLGMYLNLWLDFSKFSSVPKVFSSVPTLDVHVAVGVLIMSIATTRFALGLLRQNRPFRIPSIFIFIFALLAFASGVEFTFFGQNDIFSFTMELGFGGIIVSVASLIYVSARLQGMKGQPQATKP